MFRKAGEGGFLEGVEINGNNSSGQPIVQRDHQSPENVISGCRWLAREERASSSCSLPRGR